jgi:hypothetical protein
VTFTRLAARELLTEGPVRGAVAATPFGRARSLGVLARRRSVATFWGGATRGRRSILIGYYAIRDYKEAKR